MGKEIDLAEEKITIKTDRHVVTLAKTMQQKSKKHINQIKQKQTKEKKKKRENTDSLYPTNVCFYLQSLYNYVFR